MPRNMLQRMIFALLTVIITVHAFVFYNVYVISGPALMAATNTTSVAEALAVQGGLYMFGTIVPIWAVILIELFCAYSLELVLGGPLSFRFASKMFNPSKNHPVIFETVIICATVGIMCPAMSLLASVFYYPYYTGFSVWAMLAIWFKLVCFNLPFAFFSQVFFIQPIVRNLFRALFAKDIKKRMEKTHTEVAKTEEDVIADILTRITEIQQELHIKQK